MSNELNNTQVKPGIETALETTDTLIDDDEIRQINTYGRQFFEKGSPTIFRVGVEGTKNKDERYMVIMDDVTLLDIASNTKSTMSKSELLEGTIDKLLDVMINKVDQFLTYQNEKLGSQNISYKGIVNVTTVSGEDMPKFITARDRIRDLYADPSKTKLLVEKRKSPASISEPVMEAMGKLQIYQGKELISEGNVIDLVIGKDSSGGMVYTFKTGNYVCQLGASD